MKRPTTDRETILAALRIASERTAYPEEDVYASLLRQIEAGRRIEEILEPTGEKQ